MKNMDHTKKRLIKEAHEMAKGLHKLGAMNQTTMHEFDALCLSKIHELSPTKIRKLRKSTGMSQPVFAKVINVSPAAIKQWECGARKPSGAALKLLNLVAEM